MTAQCRCSWLVSSLPQGDSGIQPFSICGCPSFPALESPQSSQWMGRKAQPHLTSLECKWHFRHSSWQEPVIIPVRNRQPLPSKTLITGRADFGGRWVIFPLPYPLPINIHLPPFLHTCRYSPAPWVSLINTSSAKHRTRNVISIRFLQSSSWNGK